MKNIEILKGLTEKAPYRSKPGLDLDNWMYQYLRKLGKTITTPACCGTTNLYLKQGTYELTTKQDKTLFDFESYILALLVKYTIITQNEMDARCCYFKKRLKVPIEYIVVKRTPKYTKASIERWLINLLQSTGLTYDDPCC